MSYPFMPASFALALTVGCKDPNSAIINRKSFLFTGFEDRSLANDFANRLTNFFVGFAQENAQKHTVYEHVWIVRPIQYAAPREALASTEVLITPSYKLEKIIEEILQKFEISMERVST